MGLVGVALVARPEGELTREHWTGVLALQVAAISWTIGSLYTQSRPQKLPLFTASAVQMLAGSAVLFLEALADAARTRARLLARFVHGLGGAPLPAGLRLPRGLHRLRLLPERAARPTVGTYAYVNPVVAVALGALILGEPLSPGLLLGGLLIVSSVVGDVDLRRRS